MPSHPQDKRRLEALLSRIWALAGEEEHPLGRLQGLSLGPYRLLALLGPKNNVGSRYLQLFLVDSEGRMSEEPVAFGLHNSGPYPGYNWFEVVRYEPALSFQGEPEDLRVAGVGGGGVGGGGPLGAARGGPVGGGGFALPGWEGVGVGERGDHGWGGGLLQKKHRRQHR